MKKTRQEQKFEKYREYLNSETQLLWQYISLYKHLHKKVQDRLDEINIAPAFFSTVQSALFTCIVLWIHNLFSEESQRGLHDFLNFIESNLSTFKLSELKRRREFSDNHWFLKKITELTKSDISGHRAMLKSIKLLNSIKTRRDKYHAHFDKKYFFNREKINKEKPILWKDLDEIKEPMEKIINTYSVAYDGSSFSIQFVNAYDVDRILDILHEYREKRKRRT
ncbi:MAG: hypothetical protein K9M00_01810 [Candidatus Omnitrophica bacterium]|nr:hypothetical protein [Candidatus Omnitrophota bacterium]